MWAGPLMKALGRLAANEATVATYTTARSVRDALAAAGFVVDKRPGFGRKRDMLAGRYAPRWTTRHPRALAAPQWPQRRAIVVGAGLAGSAVAERLSARGWRIDLLDGAAKGESSAVILHAGISQPHISRDDCVLSRLTRAGFLYQRAQETTWDASIGERSGALQLAVDDESEAAMADMVEAQRLPGDYACYVTRDEASAAAERPGFCRGFGGFRLRAGYAPARWWAHDCKHFRETREERPTHSNLTM